MDVSEKCVKILLECIAIEHVLDNDYVYGKLEEYYSIFNELPDSLQKITEKFVNEVLIPNLKDNEMNGYCRRGYADKFEGGCFELNIADLSNDINYIAYEKWNLLKKELRKSINRYVNS